jgi:hypothetical protein
VVITVDEVKLAWVDNGHKMWNVTYTRTKDNTQWVMRHWAKDELDAYNIAVKKVAGAS